MRKLLPICFLVVGLFALFMLPHASFASEGDVTVTKNVITEETTPQQESLENKENEEEALSQHNETLDNSAEINSIVGGGTLGCKGQAYGSVCNITLLFIEPVSSAKLTVTYYKVNNNGTTTKVGENIFTKKVSGGKSLYEQIIKYHPTPGKYKAKLTGIAYGYSSTVAIKTIWSSTFTVTK